VLVGGVLARYVERGGRTIRSYVDDEGALATAAKALAEAVHAGALGVLSVQRTDGAPITIRYSAGPSPPGGSGRRRVACG
jgi:ATP-dependent Lhr-like helicase